MRYFFFLFAILFSVSELFAEKPAGEAIISAETMACIGCHETYTPGIVADWRTSRHSKTTPGLGMKKPALERRISASQVDPALKDTAVGCYECHSRNPEAHKDNFEHFGSMINVVVSPKDCATCHPVEESQYTPSKKGNALLNLEKNPVYHTLYSTILGVKTATDTGLSTEEPSDFTRQDACFACHGTEVEAKGLKEIDTELGKIKVPDLTNWPNMGVGRVNPDGSRGACTACHPRHSFSIEIARKPYTCAQCHLQPDVPAWDVYAESKHGAILFSKSEEWDFTDVPWRPGKDFLAPTCSTCHNSLLLGPDGEPLAQRSHDFGARLWVRIFGLPYSHPQPKQGNTTIIKNKDGLPLPTTFAGEPASEYLIDEAEQTRREDLMKAVCHGCHNRDWVDMHFEKFANTVKETDRMTLAATKLLLTAWEEKLADEKNPFDEGLEQDWVKQWLFNATTARYASAMTGAPDYVAFKYGFWELTNNLQKMKESIEAKRKLKGLK